MPTYKDPFEPSLSFDNEKDFLDYVAAQYQTMMLTKKELEDKLAIAVEVFDKHAGDRQKRTGTVHAVGNKYDIVVTRNERVNYERDADGEHPLFTLVKRFKDLLKDKIKLTIDEKGTQISKLIDGWEKNPSLMSKEEKELSLELEKYRNTHPGKPGIEIKIVKSKRES